MGSWFFFINNSFIENNFYFKTFFVIISTDYYITEISKATIQLYWASPFGGLTNDDRIFYTMVIYRNIKAYSDLLLATYILFYPTSVNGFISLGSIFEYELSISIFRLIIYLI